MGKLLKFEYRKLFRQTSFYVCLIVMAVMVLLNEGIYFALTENSKAMMEAGGDAAVMVSVLGDGANNGIISMLRAFSECSFEILAAIFISINICSDYTQNTIRNVVTKGYSRTQIFIGKFVVCLTGCIIMLVGAAAFSGLLGTIFWEAGQADMTMVAYNLLGQLLIVIAETALFFMISDIIRKNGGAIALGIILPLTTSLIATILTSVTQTQLDWDYDFNQIFLSKYMVETSGLQDKASAALEVLGKTSIVCGIYLVLCLGLAWVWNRKKEV